MSDFRAFEGAAFFGTLEERRKQRELEKQTSIRTGLEERRTATAERQETRLAGQQDVAFDAATQATERERLETLITSTAGNLARESVSSGKLTGDSETIQGIMAGIQQMETLAGDLFGKGELEFLFRNSFDEQRNALLGGAAVEGGNVEVVTTGEIISQQSARERIAGGEAVTNFREAPAETRTGPTTLGGDAALRLLTESGVQTQALIRNLSDAKEQLRIDPASGQFVGDVALFANNVAANVDTLARVFGVDPAAVQEDRQQFARFAEGLAGSTSVFNAALIDAAYAKALIQNGTRPTESDFQNAYRSITGGSQNAGIIIQNLDRAIDGVIDDHNNRVRFSIQDPTQREQFIITAPDGRADLTPGQIIIQNGVRFQVQPDGSVVELP